MSGRLGIMRDLRVGMGGVLGVARERAAGSGMAVPGEWMVVMVGDAVGIEWLGVRVMCVRGSVGFVVLPMMLKMWVDLVGLVGWRLA